MKAARLFITFGFVLMNAGCAGAHEASDDPANDDVGTVESASSEERSVGAYEVPVDASLAHVATNPVSLRLRALGGNRYRLKYDLPTTLGGVDKEVDLTGSRSANGTWTLSGAAGTADCTEAAGEIRCNEVLAGVQVNLAEVTTALDASPVMSAAERVDRFTVAAKFAQDPLGVLTFRRRASGRGKNR